MQHLYDITNNTTKTSEKNLSIEQLTDRLSAITSNLENVNQLIKAIKAGAFTYDLESALNVSITSKTIW